MCFFGYTENVSNIKKDKFFFQIALVRQGFGGINETFLSFWRYQRPNFGQNRGQKYKIFSLEVNFPFGML